jgi:hypothetical protein
VIRIRLLDSLGGSKYVEFQSVPLTLVGDIEEDGRCPTS